MRNTWDETKIQEKLHPGKAIVAVHIHMCGGNYRYAGMSAVEPDDPRISHTTVVQAGPDGVIFLD